MHANATHHLEQLLEDDCWSLFEKHAFRGCSAKVDPKIIKIGEQIVNNCKGLPLAIKAIGDLLWSESDVERWTKILESDLWEETKILPALRLSYKYLPSYLKQCFAYCSIFPKDYVFKKNELVLLWMAEGFLQQSKKESMEEVGNRYFQALVSRSLFQQSSKTNSSFVMHDLVNDLANFVSGQFGFMLDDNSSKEMGNVTRYIGFFPDSLYDLIEADFYRAKHLQTFMALDLPRRQIIDKIKLPMAGCLRVLSLSSLWVKTKGVDSISKMKHLHYLDLSKTHIQRLPNSICLLYNLQTLKLSGCRNLERLPIEMWKFINLRHLEIDETDKLKEMPLGMDRLKCLWTLTKLAISKQNHESRSVFESLLIRGGILHTLKELWILDCNMFELPMNQQYSSLEKLLLKSSCDSLTTFQLDSFPNVKSIIIDGCRNLKSLEHDHEGKLVISKIEIRRCSSFVSFPKGGLRAPNLHEFSLEDCESLESFPEGGLPPLLARIEIKGCKRLIAKWTEWGLEKVLFLFSLKIRGELKDVESFLGVLLLPTTLFSLGIYSFPNLESLENEGFQRLTFLNTLHIEGCPKLKYFPEEGFPASLETLEIKKCHHVLMEELKRKRGKEWLKVAHILDIYV